MKDNIKEELENYKWYIKKYFPYSAFCKELESEKILVLFDKIITLSKISQCLGDNATLRNYTSMIEYNLNNLLYFLPLNEPIAINVSIRNTVEYLLKLVYFFQSPEDNFLSTGYRTLKDSKSTLKFYDTKKSILDNLLSIYSSRSNKVHLKSTDSKMVLTSVLEEKLIRDLEEKDLNSIIIDINNCTKVLLEALFFYQVNVSTQQKIILKRLVSRKWIDKINSI